MQGAAEIVLAQCERYVGPDGQLQPLDEAKRAELFEIVTQMAQQGLRTLCLSYRDFQTTENAQAESFDVPPEERLTACCIVGIKVPPISLKCSSAFSQFRQETADGCSMISHGVLLMNKTK